MRICTHCYEQFPNHRTFCWGCLRRTKLLTDEEKKNYLEGLSTQEPVGVGWIIFAVIFTGWGLLIGGNFFRKLHTKKRGMVMICIELAKLGLIPSALIFDPLSIFLLMRF